MSNIQEKSLKRKLKRLKTSKKKQSKKDQNNESEPIGDANTEIYDKTPTFEEILSKDQSDPSKSESIMLVCVIYRNIFLRNPVF